jgi:hypothetical protein
VVLAAPFRFGRDLDAVHFGRHRSNDSHALCTCLKLALAAIEAPGEVIHVSNQFFLHLAEAGVYDLATNIVVTPGSCEATTLEDSDSEVMVDPVEPPMVM